MVGPQRAHGGPALELLHVDLIGRVEDGCQSRYEVPDAGHAVTRRRGREELVQEKTKTSFVCEEAPRRGHDAGLHGAM